MPSDEDYRLSFPCNAGDIDFFITHSWGDSAEQKVAKIEALRAEFKITHGREPTAWFDRYCLHHRDVSVDLACLPVYIMACNSMLVLSGSTYTKRLWCVWELYTFFAICPEDSCDRLVLMSLDNSASTIQMLRDFNLDEAECKSTKNALELRNVIDCGGRHRKHHPAWHRDPACNPACNTITGICLRRLFGISHST